MRLPVRCLPAHRLRSFNLRWLEGMPFAYLHLSQGWRATSFARAAEEASVLVRTAYQYAPAQGREPFAALLAMACGRPLAEFDAGLVRLAQLLARPPTDLAV